MAFIVKSFWVIVGLIALGWIISLGINGLSTPQKEVTQDIELKK